MSHFHVIAKLNSNTDQSCIFSDLSLSDLNEKFIKPYKKGSDFLSKNILVKVKDLESIHVIETVNNIDTELNAIKQKSREEIDRINHELNITLISLGRGYAQ